MSSTATASNTTVPTQILQGSGHSYAYRRFGKGSGLPLLCLQHFVQGFHDEVIPVRNSYWLAENLPNAALLAYPDAGHGSLFQYPESFTRQAAAFLSSDSESAVF